MSGITSYRLFIALLALLLAGLLLRLWTGEGSLAHVTGLEEKAASLEAKNEAKRQRNDILRAEVRDLKDGLVAVEEAARSELGLIKEGETFFLVTED
ncbi:MAG: septum formation initiator family protein [Pseudomonadales bacterium]